MPIKQPTNNPKKGFNLRARELKSYEEYFNSSLFDESDHDLVYQRKGFSRFPNHSTSESSESDDASSVTEWDSDGLPPKPNNIRSKNPSPPFRKPTISSLHKTTAISTHNGSSSKTFSNKEPRTTTNREVPSTPVNQIPIRNRPRVDYNEANTFKNICNLETFFQKEPSPSETSQKRRKVDHLSSPQQQDDSSSSDDESIKKKLNIKPVEIDAKSVGLDFVAGLDDCICKLKEMVTYPLLYPEFYEKIGIAPPRGVLFYGPPGTGKTLVARALAKFCSNFGQNVAFYVRNGGDCLSKYIGEAERNIRLLFEDARRNQPSIIFFDEIDAIAPARNSKNEQTHLSVVATLLAEMDGLKDRGQIVVIGATNRINSLDPALRRPGRFDREFYFPMPCKEARKKILDSHTRNWNLDESLKEDLAEITYGYSGSDIKGLCLEAAIKAFNRAVSSPFFNPSLPIESVNVSIVDFLSAFREIVPSSKRYSASSISLGKQSKILISSFVCEIVSFLKEFIQKVPSIDRPDPNSSIYKSVKVALENIDYEMFYSFRPRILIEGIPGMQAELIAQHSFNFIDNVIVHSLDILNLYEETVCSSEANLIRILNEAKSRTPSIIFVPGIDFWWDRISKAMRNIFLRFITAIHPREPVILVVTAECPLNSLAPPIQQIFSQNSSIVYPIKEIPCEVRKEFFEMIIHRINKLLPHRNTLNADVIRLHSHFENGILAALAKIPKDGRDVFDGLMEKVKNYSFLYVDDFLEEFNLIFDKYFTENLSQSDSLRNQPKIYHESRNENDFTNFNQFEIHSSHEKYSEEDKRSKQAEMNLLLIKENMHTHIHTLDIPLIMKYSRTTSDKKALKKDMPGEESTFGIPDLIASATANATIDDLEMIRIEIEKYSLSKTNIGFNELMSLIEQRISCDKSVVVQLTQ